MHVGDESPSALRTPSENGAGRSSPLECGAHQETIFSWGWGLLRGSEPSSHGKGSTLGTAQGGGRGSCCWPAERPLARLDSHPGRSGGRGGLPRVPPLWVGNPTTDQNSFLKE